MKSLSIEKMENVSGGQYTEEQFVCGAAVAAAGVAYATAFLFPPAAITMGALGLLFGGAWLSTVGIVMGCKD